MLKASSVCWCSVDEQPPQFASVDDFQSPVAYDRDDALGIFLLMVSVYSRREEVHSSEARAGAVRQDSTE